MFDVEEGRGVSLLLCLYAHRDTSDRKRMAAYPYQGVHGRTAASNFSVVSVAAAGGAAVVEWRLETGRTHQIRWVGAMAWVPN